jgi:PAS domain S-box-containing protein
MRNQHSPPPETRLTPAAPARPDGLRHYELLFLSLRDIILFIDRAHGSILDANQAAVTAYGHSREELLGMGICDLWPCDGIGEPGCPLRDIADPGRLTETVHRRKDGTTFPVEVSLQPAVHEDRAILISVVRDISRRKQAEVALRESEARYRALADCNMVGLMFGDAKTGQVLDANDAYLNLTGSTREDLEAGLLNWKTHTPPEYIPEQERRLQEALRTGKPQIMEKEFVHPDGTRVPVIVGGNFSDTERRLGVAFALDISDRKRMEAALRRNEEDLNRAQAQASTGSWRIDLRENRATWSQETYRILGQDPEFKVTPETLFAAAHPADIDYVRSRWHAALRGDEYDFEHRILVGGRVKWVRQRAEFERDPNGRVVTAFGTTQCVTKLKEAERELRESEERYRAVFINSHDAILLADPQADGRIVSANPAACRMFLYTEPEFLTKGRCEILDPGHPAYPAFLESRRFERRYEGELGYVRKDGSRFTGEVSSSLFRDQNEGLLAVTVIRDITERKQAETQLSDVSRQREEALARLDAIFDSAPVGIGFWDTDLRFVRVNRALAELNELAVADHIGRTPEELFPGVEIVRDIMAAWRRMLVTGEPLLNYIIEAEVPPGGGRRRTWTENFFPVAVAGKTVGIGATVLEITDRREAEQKLQRSYDEMEQLVRQRTSQLRQMSRVFMDAADPIIIEDTGGLILDMNREAERSYGWSRAELIGQPITKLFLPERHERAMLVRRSCLLGEECRNVEGLRVDHQGRVLSILMTAFPLLDENDRVVALATIAKDITVRKQIEARLIESRHRLKELSRKSIEALEADRRAVSRELHDSIGGSLSAIKFTMEEIAERVAFSCPTVMPTLQNAIGYLSDTIKESRRISVNLRPLSLDDLGLMQTINGHLQQFNLQYGIRVVQDLDDVEAHIAEALKIVIFRILQEALANVARHSQASEVHVRLKHDRGSIRLEIEDNGGGFDPQRQMVRDISLGGYGLKSMQERVEISGGVFTIRSKPGKGTRVRAKFPRTEDASGK